MGNAPQPQVVLEGTRAITNLLLGGPGGRAEYRGERTVAEWSRDVVRRGARSMSWVLGLVPVGLPVRAIYHRNGRFVVLLEYPPMKRTMPWIRDESRADYGLETSYAEVQVALPYVVFFWVVADNGSLCPSSVFFRTAPLTKSDFSEELLDCHFLNCSVQAYEVYCWICPQRMRQAMKKDESLFEYVAECTDYFFFAPFNRSSEHHEGNSFFGKGSGGERQIPDPRVQSIAAWVAASEAELQFVLDVPWNPSGYTVQDVFRELAGGEDEPWPFQAASDLSCHILNVRRKGG